MPQKITSTIEIETRGCDMPNKKHKAVADPHDHNYTSTATSHRNRLFHNVKNANAGVTQNVSVSVKVEKEDDCMTSCFAGLAKCFGRGASGS